MTVTEGKSCLLIMPTSFYSFARTIGGALQELGYTVTEANEEYPENALGKLMAKLDLPIARRITREVFRKRFLANRHYDLVVIIKGRGIGPRLVADLKRHATRVVGYHFDALAYDRPTERWAQGVDRVSTFDYRDAAAKGWPVVELFSAEQPPKMLEPITIPFSAIMRNHSDRLAYLDRVARALGPPPGGMFVYIFEQDVRSLTINFLRQPLLYWRWRKHIHRTPLPYADYRRVLATSDFTIDYAHPKQTGLTMRSFEALASGTKLITNNPSIRQSPHFSDLNAVVFDRTTEPAVVREQIAARTGRRPPARWRSATDCLLEIIGDPGCGGVASARSPSVPAGASQAPGKQRKGG